MCLIPSLIKDISMSSARSAYIVSAQRQNQPMVKNIKTATTFKNNASSYIGLGRVSYS